MDPTACLQAMLESIQAYHKAIHTEDKEIEVEDTIVHLEHLLQWLKNDGFMPEIPDKYKQEVFND